MHYINSRISITRKDAVRWINKAFDVLNASREWSYDYEDVAINHMLTDKVNDAIYILQMMLDASDRKVLWDTIKNSGVEVYEKLLEPAKLKENDTFAKWILEVRKHSQLSLAEFDPHRRTITFTCIPLLKK